MLFPTIEFALFFMTVLPLTWALNRRNELKKLMLVGVSYAFYSCWSVAFLPLLVLSSVGNYGFGRLIAACEGPRRRGMAVGCAVALNLAPLCYFKYYDFAAAQLQSLADLAGWPVALGSTGLAVPVAISFLTFHGISYVVDVHRRTIPASRSLLDLMLYVSFFPHLVAGPIVRAAEFLGQLARPSNPGRIDLSGSALLILGGLFKKVVVASHLSVLYVDPVVTNPGAYGSVDLILAAYAYAIVIYCDFSAYTDIAIGVANLLGYRFPQNFDQPYIALSLQEFWRRWHITLSSWLRDYLYVPLGGSRGGRLLTLRNLVLTMVLGGLWHGAGLQFLVWGALHGVGLAAERGLREATDPRGRLRGFLRSEAGEALRWILVFHFVCLAWIFFRAPDCASALDYLAAIGRGLGGPAPLAATPLVLALMAAGAATQLAPPALAAAARSLYGGAGLPAKVALGTALAWLVAMLSPSGVAPFIYFQF
ncbi:membrane bound O-acyl transferase MBOAT family protein [Methylobacterium sp. 4-46]|uniref:MBOAT family O-acyltransferase n=1 Tax=unclassified Methylobacterium TaxID=2615210 RepID=UPI000152D799|nr:MULTISPECIES: MBOAT family protein [Methylobacterium]ACA18968.1 membrane bound O-acyl transferase MBOAT family protein [Methylobacterium sp. 4-46]WFT78186.1 MBOAT family protein [Methylobacterium nodulans]